MLSDISPKSELYQCDGATTEFAFVFTVQFSTDINVIIVDSSNTEVELTIGSQFTVSLNANGTGSITTTATYSSDYQLMIKRDTPETQTLDLQEGGFFSAEALEAALDKNIRLTQENTEKLSRAALLSPTSQIIVSLPTPSPNTSLCWNAFGTGLTNCTESNIDPSTFIVLNNIAELRNTYGSAIGQSVSVLGYYTIGDGGGGPLRVWDEGKVPGFYTDNGSSIIVPTSGDGSAAWLWIPEVIQVNTIAELRLQVGFYLGQDAKVLGYYLAGDGGGGPRRTWSEGQTAGTYVDNGGSIIVPTGGDGSAAWLFDKGSYTVSVFGGTTSIDNRDRINTMLTDGNTVLLDKEYPVSDYITMDGKQAIKGTGGCLVPTVDSITLINVAATADGVNISNCVGTITNATITFVEVLNGALKTYIENNDIEGLTVAVRSTDFSELTHEIYIMDNRFTTTDITDSIGLKLHNPDNFIHGNIIRGFDTSLYQDGSGWQVIGNHFYKFPSSDYGACIYIEHGNSCVYTANYFDNGGSISDTYPVSIDASRTDALSFTGNIFLALDVDKAFINFFAASIITGFTCTGNTFKKLSVFQTSQVVSFGALVDLDNTFNFTFRNNGFSNVAVTEDSQNKSVTVLNGNSFVDVNFSNIINDIGFTQATGTSRSDISAVITGSTVRINLTSAATSDEVVYVSAKSNTSLDV